MRILDVKAQLASEKTALLGPDIYLATFESTEVLHDHVEDLSDSSHDNNPRKRLFVFDFSFLDLHS